MFFQKTAHFLYPGLSFTKMLLLPFEYASHLAVLTIQEITELLHNPGIPVRGAGKSSLYHRKCRNKNNRKPAF